MVDTGPNWQILSEAYNRGLLPPDKKAVLEEAQRRGMLPPGIALKAPTEAPQVKGAGLPPQAPGASVRENISDAAKSIPVGLTKGVVGAATTVPTLAQIGEELGSKYVSPKISQFPGFLSEIGSKAPQPLGAALQGASAMFDPKYSYPSVEGKLESTAASLGEPFHQPTTPTGRIAETAASFIPSMAVGAPETFPIRAVQGIGAGTGAGIAGELSKDSSYRPAFEMAGALLGHKIAPRAVTPFPVTDPEYAAQTGLLKSKGVPLTPGRVTGSPALLNYEASAGDRIGAPKFLSNAANTEKGAFSEATLGELGMKGPLASPQALKLAKADFQNRYDNFTKNNTLLYPNNFDNEIDKIGKDYTRITGASGSPSVNNFINRLKTGISGKVSPNSTVAGMTGDQFQDLREQMGDAIEGAKTHAESDALIQLRQKVDNAWRQSLPDDAARADWDNLNKEYSNWKVISGQKLPVDKYITPDTLANAVSNARGTQAFNLGQGSLAQLAHAGQTVLGERPPPNAETSLMTRALLGLIGGGIGYRYGPGGEPAVTGIWGTELGAGQLPAVLKYATTNPAVSNAYSNPLAQLYLTNQLLVPKTPMSNSQLWARALTGSVSGQDALPPPQGNTQ